MNRAGTETKNFRQNIREHTTVANFADARDFLQESLPSSPKVLYSKDVGLKRAKIFYELLGNPQENYKSIHIAGTSGKGSTAYYLSSLLQKHGFKVGTHVSPHIYDIRERAMINLKWMPKLQFIECVNSLIPKINKMGSSFYGRPTYFEVCTAMAFILFRNENVDYAVVETGIGGQYDATNTINRNDKLSVITRIGLDHTNILGETIADITRQKAQILTNRGSGLFLNSGQEAREVIIDVAATKNANTHEVNIDNFANNIRVSWKGILFDYSGKVDIKDIFIPTIAKYQVENATMAIQALETLASRDGFDIDKNKVKDAFATTYIPARMEVRNIRGKTVILDGAHNPQEIRILIDSLNELNLAKKPVFIFGAKADKDAGEMLDIILPYAQKVNLCSFFGDTKTSHLRSLSSKSKKMVAVINESKFRNKIGKFFNNPHDALMQTIDENNDKEQIIVMTGSMYMIGDLRLSS